MSGATYNLGNTACLLAAPYILQAMEGLALCHYAGWSAWRAERIGGGKCHSERRRPVQWTARGAVPGACDALIRGPETKTSLTIRRCRAENAKNMDVPRHRDPKLPAWKIRKTPLA